MDVRIPHRASREITLAVTGRALARGITVVERATTQLVLFVEPFARGSAQHITLAGVATVAASDLVGPNRTLTWGAVTNVMLNRRRNIVTSAGTFGNHHCSLQRCVSIFFLISFSLRSCHVPHGFSCNRSHCPMIYFFNFQSALYSI